MTSETKSEKARPNMSILRSRYGALEDDRKIIIFARLTPSHCITRVWSGFEAKKGAQSGICMALTGWHRDKPRKSATHGPLIGGSRQHRFEPHIDFGPSRQIHARHAHTAQDGRDIKIGNGETRFGKKSAGFA